MSKAILNNDVLDIIYDSICGYSLDEAYKILEDHRRGRYIPVEWIMKYSRKEISISDYWALVRMVKKWERENGKDSE